MTTEIKNIVEGILMAAEEPLSIEYMLKLLRSEKIEINASELKATLAELIADYQGRGIELKEVASGYRFQVHDDLSLWVNKLWEEKPPRYSSAFLETLAIIAYKQPITRAEIEDIRGVSVSSNIVKTILEHGWAKVIGYKNVPGKPALFVTTAKFLDHFNLKSLSELPNLLEFSEIADVGEIADKNDIRVGNTDNSSEKTTVVDDDEVIITIASEETV